MVLLPLVWPPARSLAATWAISFDFSSSAYLDVSVQRVAFVKLWIHLTITDFSSAGFPHSEIHGSTPICGSPWLIAACHVLLRLLMPRHSPYALSSLTFMLPLSSDSSFSLLVFKPFFDNFDISLWLQCSVFKVLSEPRASVCSCLLASSRFPFRKYFVMGSVSKLSVCNSFSDFSLPSQSRLLCALHFVLCSVLVGLSGLELSAFFGLSDKFLCHMFGLVRLIPHHSSRNDVGGLKWTRTTDLTLIRRAL